MWPRASLETPSSGSFHFQKYIFLLVFKCNRSRHWLRVVRTAVRSKSAYSCMARFLWIFNRIFEKFKATLRAIIPGSFSASLHQDIMHPDIEGAAWKFRKVILSNFDRIFKLLVSGRLLLFKVTQVHRVKFSWPPSWAKKSISWIFFCFSPNLGIFLYYVYWWILYFSLSFFLRNKILNFGEMGDSWLPKKSWSFCYIGCKNHFSPSPAWLGVLGLFWFSRANFTGS